MNRTQFVLVIVALAVLVAAGWGVLQWKRGTYETADSRVGQKLVQGFKVDDVGQIEIADAKGTVTLVRGEQGWTVKERGGYPANLEPIRDLLVKLLELKVVQAEGINDAVKPRLQLVAPGGGGKPEDTGTALELKARDGKPIARMVLGKKPTKESGQPQMPGMPPLPGGIPSGRYIWLASDPQRMNVVAEPFSSVVARPESWIARDYVRVERVKSLTALDPDGKERWTVARDAEGGEWKLAGKTEGGKLDAGKAQDAASALYGVTIADVAVDAADADTGLDKPVVIKAETFDGWRYDVRIGKAGPEGRRYVRTSVEGSVPGERTAPADEKAEDKEKQDKAFAERKQAAAAKLEREKALAPFVVLVQAAAVDPLLRERAALLAVEKKPEAKKDGEKSKRR